MLNIHYRQAFAYHRYPLNFLRQKPEFFIIGVQKAGTSSLFDYLIRQPEINPPLIKELQFFSMNYNRGISYYHSFFPFGRKQTITGEATPDYFDHPQAAERLFRYQPDAKLILILRNPVERAFSHFNFVQSYNSFIRSLTFEQAIEQEEKLLRSAFDKLSKNPVEAAIDISNYGFLYKGRYAEHLERWLQYFDGKNILLLDFNEIKHNPETLTQKVCEFIRIDYRVKIKVNDIKNKTTYNNSLVPDTRKKLVEYFAPYNKRLSELTGKTFDWD